VRNIPIPVDTARLTFVCVSEPRPRLVSQDTGEVKVDRNGQTVYQVGLSAADPNGRVELVNVSVSGEPKVRVGQVVEPAGLVGFVWEQTRNGEVRWGIAYRADAMQGSLLADPLARRPLPEPAGAFDLGALGGTRTPNLLIRSQMLYPLSYERTK
jgi:hypothetical protein